MNENYPLQSTLNSSRTEPPKAATDLLHTDATTKQVLKFSESTSPIHTAIWMRGSCASSLPPPPCEWRWYTSGGSIRGVSFGNVIWPNNSNVVTVTVLTGNLHENRFCRYMRRSVCPPGRPTNSSSHFCPKNSICHRQKKFTHRVFV